MMAPLRISIATGPFFPLPPAPCGAVERIWWDLAREFARRGHRVVLLARAPDEESGAPVARDGVRIVPLSRWQSSSLLPLNLGKDAVYALHAVARLPPADILVTNTFWLPVLARLRPRAGRVVVSVARMPKGQMRLYRAASVACLAGVSGAIGRAIQSECPAAAGMVGVVPNPIDTDRFHPAGSPIQLRPPFEMIYAGRLHPEKGVHLLVRAAALLHRSGLVFRLRVAGPWRTMQGGGGEEYRGLLKDLAAGLPVEFLEPIHDREAFADLLRSAHVFCYPSLAERGESFGVAPLEAMACGAVPIVSDLACFREFLRPGENGLVFDHRARDRVRRLASAIRGVLLDRPAWGRLRSEGVRDAGGFSVPRVASAYLDLFQRILRDDTR